MTTNRRVVLGSLVSVLSLGGGCMAPRSDNTSVSSSITSDSKIRSENNEYNNRITDSLSVDERPEAAVESGEFKQFVVGPHPSRLGPNTPDKFWRLKSIMVYIRAVENATNGTHRVEFLTRRTPASQFRVGRLRNDHNNHIRMNPGYVRYGEWMDTETHESVQQAFDGLLLSGDDPNSAVEFIYRNNTDATYNPTPEENPDDEIRLSVQGEILSKCE